LINQKFVEKIISILFLFCSFLHTRLRTAILRNDFEGTAVLINILLRSFLKYNLYEQAMKLTSKSTFPIQASNNEWARHLFYIGRIKAIQLEYSESYKNLVQALRKAPQNEAIGFKQTVCSIFCISILNFSLNLILLNLKKVQKFAIVVELLLGEIPDKATFRIPEFRKTLDPYFQLTQAVRTGNLARFNQVVDKFSEKFIKEDTWTLIIRFNFTLIF
jgi:26S proteasome regulatory subunit N3